MFPFAPAVLSLLRIKFPPHKSVSTDTTFLQSVFACYQQHVSWYCIRMQYHITSLMQYYITSLMQYYFTSLMQYYITSLMQYYITSLMQYHITSLMQYYITSLMQYYINGTTLMVLHLWYYLLHENPASANPNKALVSLIWKLVMQKLKNLFIHNEVLVEKDFAKDQHSKVV